MNLFYDFHIHSCLSPCAEEEMTPNNIVNMAALAGLNVIAITDHNSCGNCGAAIEAAKSSQPGLMVLPGMELETREEVHLICLFANLEKAQAFESTIHDRLPPVKNRPDIYGHQYMMDAQDKILCEMEQLLVVAADIGVEEAVRLAAEHGGIAVAAHLDRSSNSVISNLGFLTEHMGFTCYELSRSLVKEKINDFVEKHHLMSYNRIGCSDAHRLEEIRDADLTVEVTEFTPEAILRSLSQKPR